MPRLDSESDVVSRKIIRLYESGKSLKEVGEAVGMSYQGVCYRLERAGVSRRKPSGGAGTARYQWSQKNGMVPVTSLQPKSGGRAMKTIRAAIKRLGVVVHRKGNWSYVREKDAERVIAAMNGMYELTAVPWRSAGVSEWEMGWLAGILDGEGHVIVRAKKGRWDARIQVGSTTPPLLEKVKSILVRLGINFSETHVKSKKAKTKDSCNITVNECVSTWRLCREVFPFMVLKREEVNLLMGFSEKRAKNARRRGGVMDAAEEYAAKFAALR